jgi:hypothetical protein
LEDGIVASIFLFERTARRRGDEQQRLRGQERPHLFLRRLEASPPQPRRGAQIKKLMHDTRPAFMTLHFLARFLYLCRFNFVQGIKTHYGKFFDETVWHKGR